MTKFQQELDEIVDKDNIAVRCKGCKSIIYIAINHPKVMDEAAKKEVLEMVIEGHSVEHMTLAEFRADQKTFGCQCRKSDK